MYFYENARRLAVAVYGKNKLPLHATLPMGALTKSAAACITYPLLLIKARLYQPVEAGAVGGNKNKYKNFSHVATSVIRREGAAGFYKGLTAHLAKTAPGSAITFATYEYLIFLMNARW
ncbi:hypothetical protein MHBO_002805 [Bonamia ostreae]|uniref:Uncharacterized protein n=1 Tax=Bonamia ostreae TaxID=126728 RepID=A0ABV2ANK0_9EUKA